MAKKKNAESTVGEQMDLIDVAPENMKKIKPLAKKYRAAVKRRMAVLDEEKELKDKLLDMVKAAHLSRLEDGTIKFRCDGMLITVTPRDELIRVKGEEEDSK
jgi:hypothetical protein